MPSSIINTETAGELKKLAQQNNGLLKPSIVVDSARDEESPLHKYFEWDDSAAAEAYRIVQARMLIQRIEVVYKIGDEEARRPQFVSLTTDRDEDGGYRELVTVVSNKTMRNQLIKDAMTDMQIFTRRYEQIRELARVISEMNMAKVKLGK